MNEPVAMSAVYVGKVVHKRLRPRPHALSYGVFTLLLDLDRLDEIASACRLFSVNRANFVSFHERDHGEPPADTTGPSRRLAERVRGEMAAQTLTKPCTKPNSTVEYHRKLYSGPRGKAEHKNKNDTRGNSLKWLRRIRFNIICEAGFGTETGMESASSSKVKAQRNHLLQLAADVMEEVCEAGGTEEHVSITDRLKALPPPEPQSDKATGCEYWMSSTLEDPGLTPDEIEAVQHLYGKLKRESQAGSQYHHHLRGWLALILYCRAADMSVRQHIGDPWRLRAPEREPILDSNPDQYLADPAIESALTQVYGLTLLQSSHNRMLRHISGGRTSYVFRVSGPEDVVVKVVKPYYLKSWRMLSAFVADIEQTQSEIEHASTRLRIIQHNDRALVMGYLPGKDLGRAIADGVIKGLTVDERVDLIFGIAQRLGELSGAHLNVALDNIIIAEIVQGRDKKRRFDVQLIDFGSPSSAGNYASAGAEPKGASGNVSRAMSRFGDGSELRTDLAALGDVILSVFLDDMEEADRSFKIDEIWYRSPQFAAIIEDLLQGAPSINLSAPEVRAPEVVYKAIKERVIEELELARETSSGLKRSAVLSNPLTELASGLVSWWKITRRREIDLNSLALSSAQYLQTWAVAVNAFLSFVFAVCGYYLISSIPSAQELLIAGKFPASIAEFGELLKAIAHEMFFGDREAQAAVAGRMMAVSIVVVVAQYYNRIFSSLTTSGIPDQGARLAEVTIRGTPFVIGSLCLVTAAWIPNLWYVTSLVGPLVVATNNAMVMRLCAAVEARVKNTSRSVLLNTSALERFRQLFRRWPLGMVGAGIAIFMVGLVLRMEWISGEAFIGLAVVALCLQLLYRAQSTYNASIVQTGVRRIFNAARAN